MSVPAVIPGELPPISPSLLRHLRKCARGTECYEIDSFSYVHHTWVWRGTIDMHTDDVEAGHVSIGLIVLASWLTWLHVSGHKLMPLRPGSIFIIDPSIRHGTCLQDTSTSARGEFAAIIWEVNQQSLPTPEKIREQALVKLAALEKAMVP